MDIDTYARAHKLFDDAALDQRLLEGLRQSLEHPDRTRGIHAYAVGLAVEYGLTTYETVAFPDEQGAVPSSEHLQSRRILCFTEEAFAILRGLIGTMH